MHAQEGESLELQDEYVRKGVDEQLFRGLAFAITLIAVVRVAVPQGFQLCKVLEAADDGEAIIELQGEVGEGVIRVRNAPAASAFHLRCNNAGKDLVNGRRQLLVSVLGKPDFVEPPYLGVSLHV